MYKINANPAESAHKYTLFLALNLQGLSMNNPIYLNLSGTKQHSSRMHTARLEKIRASVSVATTRCHMGEGKG